MTRTNIAATSVAALVAAWGGAAQAQVTAQQVWDDWKAGFAVGTSGVTVGSESYANGVLTVTDLGFSVAGEDGGTAQGTLPQMTLTENGDGTVTVTTSEAFPITISTPANAETGEPASEVALAIRQTGLAMTASGTPGALTYDLTAARYAVELDGVTQGGASVPAEARLALNDVAGTYSSVTGATRDVAYDLTAASLDLLVDVTNPDDNATFSLSGQVDQFASRATMSLPLDMSAEMADAALMNGLAIDGSYTTGGADYIFAVNDPASSATNGTLSTAGGGLTFALDGESMGYDATASGVAIEAASAQLPFPISASVAEYGVNLLVPLRRTDAPAPWAFGLNLTDLDVNDEVWALFDPGALLPRDPATAILDLTGTATLLYDLADPAQAEAMEAAPVPGELNSIAIEDLNLSIAGAQVTGTGAFTLDNADTTTFPGMPKPVGTAEFQINGLNGLIDTLVSMGLVPADQVTGARMMLGLVAVPVGDDQLQSRIEVTADGQVLANGQRLR